MAEDFCGAFEPGETGRGISSVDAAGVALAANEALSARFGRSEQWLAAKLN